MIKSSGICFRRVNKVTTIIVPTTDQRKKYNENAFTSVTDIVEIDDDTTEIEDNTSRGTHRICNLNKVEACLNVNLYCNYHVHDFIEYYAYLDAKYLKLPDLYDKFKQETKKEKIEIKDWCLCIAIDIGIECSTVNLKHRLQQLHLSSKV